MPHTSPPLFSLEVNSQDIVCIKKYLPKWVQYTNINHVAPSTGNSRDDEVFTLDF